MTHRHDLHVPHAPHLTLARLHTIEQELARSHATNVAYRSRIIELESWLQASRITPAPAHALPPQPWSPHPTAPRESSPDAWHAWVILAFLVVLSFSASYAAYTLLAA